jgi:hypothetical protein
MSESGKLPFDKVLAKAQNTAQFASIREAIASVSGEEDSPNELGQMFGAKHLAHLIL